jgi:hypothetical protein
MEDIQFGLKDVIYLGTLLISFITIYWRLVIRIVKVESATQDIKKVIEMVQSIQTSLATHKAYHEGKEAGEKHEG